jgi:hypothetical protein
VQFKRAQWMFQSRPFLEFQWCISTVDRHS